MKTGRSPAAVSDGDGREFATDFSLTSVRQYGTESCFAFRTHVPLRDVHRDVRRKPTTPVVGN
ncbi:hypothetical protein EA473_04265 [Natrarchaeobius chitinivorans]|uniref:Uncharacterized protein n=1 Tax=Natrarchaeobius chitinivorans TaxID=1679083 RepID=A0A3N6MRJ3_NATCH|nr:hypothetical protein EA473_04265 [Natrarchaeobius chitinivorans]